MKKVICIITIIVFMALISGVFTEEKSVVGIDDSYTYSNINNNDDMVDAISEKLIRFHVIANSDSVEDQELKLKVRDRVLEFISPKLKDCKTIDESREILKSYDKEIQEIVKSAIVKEGYNYTVKTTLSMEDFPVKVYGNITLPPGKYEAYRIIIGSGKGRNWWCVMFPPLCFIDITKGEVSEKANEIEMKKVLNDKEYSVINNSVNISSSSKNNIKIKFKILEIFKKIKDKGTLD